jgi:hypothetical protein
MIEPPGGMIRDASCVVQNSAWRFVRSVASKSSVVIWSKASKDF